MPEDRIVSNVAQQIVCSMAKILDEEFGITGVMNTVHAYTNDQRLADVPHSDLREVGCCRKHYTNLTGAARAVGKVLPHLNGKLDGIIRLGSNSRWFVVDLFLELNKSFVDISMQL